MRKFNVKGRSIERFLKSWAEISMHFNGGADDGSSQLIEVIVCPSFSTAIDL